MSEHPDRPFAAWNPHFTPGWLSKAVADRIPESFEGHVVDPACGAGNLLVAAATRLRAASRMADELTLWGTDVSRKAVVACDGSLRSLLPNGNFSVQQADFLRNPVPVSGPVTVVMNPPFKGYGRIDRETRLHVAELTKLGGRFNLGYAFLTRAIGFYQPAKVVAILPSNWLYSRGSVFRKELDGLGGRWKWDQLGGDVFPGLSVDVGLLEWSRSTATSAATKRLLRRATPGFEVRYGVATGSDAAFESAATAAPSVGRVVTAVRGRDIGRTTGSRMWLPPETLSKGQTISTLIGKSIAGALRKRSCVASGRRKVHQLHEKVPEWMLGGPKVLIPEIVSGDVRVELDEQGARFPLHSVIAIRVPSAAKGRELVVRLKSKRIQKRLVEGSPRLANGAFRLQLEAVRREIAVWLRRQGK